MAEIVEFAERPGVYLVFSREGERIGVINGIDGEWYWQIRGLDVVYEPSLTLAIHAVLSEAIRFENARSIYAPTEEERRKRARGAKSGLARPARERRNISVNFPPTEPRP
jgi:hypothetical protein